MWDIILFELMPIFKTVSVKENTFNAFIVVGTNDAMTVNCFHVGDGRVKFSCIMWDANHEPEKTDELVCLATERETIREKLMDWHFRTEKTKT
jgi:hypothetical protein